MHPGHPAGYHRGRRVLPKAVSYTHLGFTKQSADYQMVMTELNIADDYFKAVEWGDRKSVV